ncbi:MAG: hypothetical protein ABH879_04615 [archaeon]
MKKGFISIQFNWIFILIAGAIILSFFVVVIQKQKGSSDTGLDVNLKLRLGTIITTAQQSPNTLFRLRVPRAEISHGCTGFSVGELAPTRFKYAFAPDLLKSATGELYIMVMEWNVPYKVANFLYISTPEVRYVFVDDAGGHARQVFGSFPGNVTMELVADKDGSGDAGDELQAITDNNNYKVRFVFFEDPGGYTLPALRTDDTGITAVQIGMDDGIDSYGTVKFFAYDGTGLVSVGESPWLGLPGLVGAVFSEDKESYECSVNEAFERLSIITGILKTRAAAIRDYYGGLSGDTCSPRYADSLDELDQITANSGDLANAQAIYNSAKSLKNHNSLLQLKSCEMIY